MFQGRSCKPQVLSLSLDWRSEVLFSSSLTAHETTVAQSDTVHQHLPTSHALLRIGLEPSLRKNPFFFMITIIITIIIIFNLSYQIDMPTVVKIDVSLCEHEVFHESCSIIGAQLEIVLHARAFASPRHYFSFSF